jgi:ABC-type polysaccharide/polyol phosphate export permease
MLALQSGAPGTGHIEAIIVVIAILAVIFWRDVAKILLMVALLLFLILLASGAVAVIDVLQHVIR